MVALVTTGATTGAAMVSVSVAWPLPTALLAEMVTVDVAAVVGVPLITPVEVFKLNPAGSPVAPKDVGVLLAVMV